MTSPAKTSAPTNNFEMDGGLIISSLDLEGGERREGGEGEEGGDKGPLVPLMERGERKSAATCEEARKSSCSSSYGSACSGLGER